MDRNSPVYVIEDDRSMRKLVETVLNGRGYHVQTFSTGEEFLSHDVWPQLGCVITDLCLPGIQGVKIQEELICRGSTFALIVISGCVDVSTAVRMMRHGAVTILEKPISADELVLAVEEGFSQCEHRLTMQVRMEDVQRHLALLTESESNVLKYLMKGWSHKAISSALDLSPRSVDRRRKTVLEKMQVSTLQELIALLANQSIEPTPSAYEENGDFTPSLNRNCDR